MSMIRKYHNHKLQTTPWHREEEPLNHHKTPGRQILSTVRKITDQLNLHLLSEKQKRACVSFANNMLKLYPKFVKNIFSYRAIKVRPLNIQKKTVNNEYVEGYVCGLLYHLLACNPGCSTKG